MSEASCPPEQPRKEAPRRVLPSLPAAEINGGKVGREEEEGGGEIEEEQLASSQSIIQEASKRLSLSPTGVGIIRRDFSISSSVTETDGEDSSVTVAVRVRPFSQRERRLGAKQVVRMQGNETVLTSGEGVVHRFNYDHCFWSFDHTQSEFASQRAVYVSLARPLLDRSFEGYNTCLFAYGQTGSGKSYCIMGEGEEEGVVPQFCRELFDRVSGTATNKETSKVQISYYEIYKEKIYDLLASTTTKTKTRLRVREHPVMGPYVEDLSTYVASSYKDIEHWISLGNRFRATAATGMNDRSSRSHSVFTIMLTQSSVMEGEEHSKVSRINLIDLAGSERSSVAMTSGDRLKEGASINRSLHTLGKVISLLSERSTGRRKRVYIPYRDSTLTWLLKESLGGNSKTAMIATISPADLYHGESLSTLRYAHQTRNIINVARVNEDPSARLIRDLREEIFMLRQMVGGHLDSTSSQHEIRELRDKLRESEKLLTESTRTWQERLSETEKRKKEELERLRRAGNLKVDNRRPNLVNLNEDPQLSETLLYILKDGVSTVGRAGSGSHDIQLTGALVAQDHCSLLYQSDSVVITPSEHPDAQTFVNGSLITDPTTLHHGDRVVFGGEHFFRFNHPLEVEAGAGRGGERGQHDFEYAKNELFRVQTEKMRAEQESRMREIRQSMEAQQREFESRIRDLGAQMEGQSMELSVVQQSREETEEKVEELARKNQQLEQETIKQRHLLQLERLKTEKETKDMAEKKTKLMTELEREKEKLERDIQQLTTNKQMRNRANISTTQPHSLTGEGSLLKGTELVRLSMKLQEATIICKTLGKPWTFSKEETFSPESKEEVGVRVSNTQLGQVTYWDLDKFEARLEQMRELYMAQSQAPPTTSSSSLEIAESVVSTGSDDTDPFHDPDDVWVQDSLATPTTSPQRRLTRPYSATSSRSSTPSTYPLSVRRTLDLTSSVPRSHHELLSFSRGDTPGAGQPFSSHRPHHLSLSLPRLCHDRVSRILSSRTVGEGTVFHRALQCVADMMAATRELEEAHSSHNPTQSLSVPFPETTEVRTLSLQLCVSLEQLMCHAHSLLTSCHMMSHMTRGGRGSGLLTGETCQQLLNCLTHQTALYCSRLFTSMDTELPGETGRGGGGGGDGGSTRGGLSASVEESSLSLRESLEQVTNLLGRLSLSWRVMETELEGEGEGEIQRDDCWVVGERVESFLRDQNQELETAFYRGHGEWTRLRLENSCYCIQTSLSALQPSLHSLDEGLSEVVSSVAQLLSLITAFLQDMASMQSDVWRIDDGHSIDDVIPNRHSIINMLLHLQQVESSTTSLGSHAATSQTPPPSTSSHPLLPATQALGATINKLAASAQIVLRSSAADTVPELSSKIQQHAQVAGRALKSLSTLLKTKLLRSQTAKSVNVSSQDPHTEADDDDNYV